MLEFKYPYTDANVLNLDWFLEQFKLLVEEWKSTEEKWAEMQQNFETLESTVQTFTTFVENYFENLDVQQEINNKLDAMALNGTLSDLLAPFVTSELPGVVSDQLPGEVTTQLSGVVQNQLPGVVAQQIDGAVATPAANATAAWLNANVDPVGSAVTIDRSLTIAGSAADAKVVGDKFEKIENEIVLNTYGEIRPKDFLYKTGCYLDASGSEVAITDYGYLRIPITGRHVISVRTKDFTGSFWGNLSSSTVCIFSDDINYDAVDNVDTSLGGWRNLSANPEIIVRTKDDTKWLYINVYLPNIDKLYVNISNIPITSVKTLDKNNSVY